MAIHHSVYKPLTPRSSLDVCYWKAEDSGYHTSYTPGSLECSEISEKQSIIKAKICLTSHSEVTIKPTQRASSPGLNESCECYKESPSQQRAVKRLFHERLESAADINYAFVPTPTREIAGVLHGLHFNDGHPIDSRYSSAINEPFVHTNFCYNSEAIYTPFPTTPLKKRCRSNCKISSSLNKKRLSKNIDFAVHSISCERKALQPIISSDKKFTSKPNKKIDIIKMLYRDGNSMPPIKKIFSYLSNTDIYNVTKVSTTWNYISQDVCRTKSNKEGYLSFLNDVRGNLENYSNIKTLLCPQEINVSTPRSGGTNQTKPLIEIQNVHHNNLQTIAPVSPIKSPRTTRFKKYTKAAALDSRMQLRCVRCQQPAKVTAESSGEEWVECTSVTCSHQFCKFCKCERHTGKSCIKFDLDGPSPSKRKKNSNTICTKKSKKNLRRLL